MFVRSSEFEDFQIKDSESFDQDPPILEELGIDLNHIKEKTFNVLFFKHLDSQLLQDPDMGGPFLFAIIFGTLLMLAGKLHFGSIYGFGLLGSVGVFWILNLMSQHKEIDYYRCVSILGYSLLPIVLLSTIGVFVSLSTVVGLALAFLCVLWSTYTATKFFEVILQLDEQRWLIAYPIFLMYVCFTLITIF